MKKKDLLGLKDLSKAEIQMILDVAAEMKKILVSGNKKAPQLIGKSMVSMFFENSTRTRTSFELACRYLGGHCENLDLNASSLNKGETLLDTVKNIDRMGTDLMVIRHRSGGVPKFVAEHVNASVINAGDGMNEHPTQALLDMFTMRDYFDGLSGLKVAIVGDLKHSRVVRSNVYGLSKFGSEIFVAGPQTLIPEEMEKFPSVTVCASVEEAVKNADVVMGLRLQKERMQAGLIPSEGEYAKFYGINEENLKLAKPNAILLHPGPVNRGVELTNEVCDAAQSKIYEQVTNGVAVRMAVLYLATRG